MHNRGKFWRKYHMWYSWTSCLKNMKKYTLGVWGNLFLSDVQMTMTRMTRKSWSRFPSSSDLEIQEGENYSRFRLTTLSITCILYLPWIKRSFQHWLIDSLHMKIHYIYTNLRMWIVICSFLFSLYTKERRRSLDILAWKQQRAEIPNYPDFSPQLLLLTHLAILWHSWK